MPRKRFTFRRRGPISFIIAALAFAAMFGLSRSTLFQSFRAKTEDLQFQLRGPIPTRDILIVAIDQKSLETLPEPRIFWHKYYAEAVEAAMAGGARVLGLDVVFLIPVEKWEPDYDRALAEAIAASAANLPVICGYIPSQTSNQRQWPVPMNMIASALGVAGYVNFTVDSDDFVREQELLEAPDRVGESQAHSFALKVTEKYLNSPAELRGGVLWLAGKPVPIGPNRRMRINYAGPPGTFPRISFSDFIAAWRVRDLQRIRNWVHGRIVVVGGDYIDDRYPTPYFPLRGSSKWNTSGTEIHASAIHTLLSRNFLQPAPEWANQLFLVVVVWGTSLLAVYLPLGRAIAAAILFAVAALAVSHMAFRMGTMAPVLEIPVSAAFAILFGSIYRFLAADERGRFLRRAIAIFVGGDVAKTLETAEEISMAGSRMVVTILFSDIRGFTSFCDGQDPGAVVSLLNVYFSKMVSIITSYQGHVNKFIGDGILAIFSDRDGPGLEDHALRAVRCGMAMNAADLPPFKTGVGIHTGAVVIGNVGSAEKLEYTALGDTVNLASRLESMNKEKHTQLLMSSSTYERLGGEIKSRLIGAIPIRGKTIPVDLYTVALEEPAEVAGVHT